MWRHYSSVYVSAYNDFTKLRNARRVTSNLFIIAELEVKNKHFTYIG